MSHLTEQAIQTAFIKLLNERPLDKITVREIAEECGINRNTFYYHYHDVYDLLETLFAAEESRMLSDTQSITSLQQGFKTATRFALENRQALYHVYNSVNRDILTRYLYNSAAIAMRHYVLNQCGDELPNEHDLEDLVFLYASMIEGAIINIMREGLTRDVESFIENAIKLMDGTLHVALKNCRRDNL